MGQGTCAEALCDVERGLVKSSDSQCGLTLGGNVERDEPRTQVGKCSSCPGATLEVLIFNKLGQSRSVAQAGLQLTLQTRMAFSSYSLCICLLNSGTMVCATTPGWIQIFKIGQHVPVTCLKDHPSCGSSQLEELSVYVQKHLAY